MYGNSIRILYLYTYPKSEYNRHIFRLHPGRDSISIYFLPHSAKDSIDILHCTIILKNQKYYYTSKN